MSLDTTPALQRVLDAAVSQFAQHGYEGASLSGIAAEAGIRKASLYSHVKNKNTLFLTVFESAQQHEMYHARKCFDDDDNTLPGQAYLDSLPTHYVNSSEFRFLLRTSYLPPESLFDELQDGYELYIQQLKADFTDALRAHLSPSNFEHHAETLGQAYIGIVDSLHVALIYVGQARFEARLSALKRLMADSIERLQRSPS